MSDLCYNCGDCHLPRPCPVSLKYCEICQNFGHAYSFCPLSVRKKEPAYQFWALCHNCDSWHLPEPCKLDLRTCRQCGHIGHLEYFCPVSPLSRQATVGFNNHQNGAQTGVKRQRTGDFGVNETVDSQSFGDSNRAENIRLLKAATAREVLGLRSQGFADHDILQHITRAPLDIYVNNGTAAADSVFKMPKTETPLASNLQQPPTPSTSVYTSQHERFSSGELAQNIRTQYADQQAANIQQPHPQPQYTVDFYHPTPQAAPQVPPPSVIKPTTRKKSTRGPACAECKGSRKKCPHGDAAVPTPAPPGFVEASSINYGPPPNTQYLAPAWTTPTRDPLYNVTMSTADFNTISAPMNSLQNYGKADLRQLLNEDSGGQQVPGNSKPFTYTPVGGNYAMQANNQPTIPVPGSNNEAAVTAEKFDIPESPHTPAQARPEAQDPKAGGFVMVPHVAQFDQNQAQQQVQMQMPEQPQQPHEEVEMESALVQSVEQVPVQDSQTQCAQEQPQDQMQSEQPQLQSEPASETTKDEGKSKKAGRGRPKRKN